MMCFNIVTQDMFLVFDFKPIITPFWICKNDEIKENNTTNPVNNPPPPTISVHYSRVVNIGYKISICVHISSGSGSKFEVYFKF